MNYKDVCGNDEKVWFEVGESHSKQFLLQVKQLGCTWQSGAEIEPENDIKSPFYAIRCDGTIALVSAFIWYANHPTLSKIRREVFICN